MNQWYYRPDYMAIMSDCSNATMGVWSANSLDRTVVVAVYGKATRIAISAVIREFGSATT